MTFRFHVLLVEDSPDDVAFIQEMAHDLEADLLHPVVLKLSHAATLAETLTRDLSDIDVVLLDLTLPDSRGLQTVEDFFSPARPAVPVIVLTGRDDVELAVQALKHGAQDYLVKNQLSSVVLLRSIQYARERFAILQEKEQLIAKLQDALGQIKTLTGLLPICANCKKIRNDQGYWERIEAYIAKHSRAEFTHGLCPECREKLYPREDSRRG